MNEQTTLLPPPALHVTAETTDTASEDTAPHGQPAAPRAAMNVLLVEDDEGHAQITRMALHRANLGTKIEHVSSVAEALATISAHTFDVALLDLGLPDSSGTEAVAMVRSRSRELPIVALTSQADDQMALNAIDGGAQDYLVKGTMTPESLARSIRNAIHRQQAVCENQRLVRELEASQEALEKRNRRVSRLYRTAHRFVDNVSHEFRTPLTVVKEYVALMREGLLGPLNDEQRRFLDVVNDRADDLNHMVDDMLDVSKLEAGILTICRTRTQLAPVVDHVRLGLERRAALKNVELEIDVAQDLPDIYCDGEKVGRVIVNLVSNAIKFCGNPGRVRLEARLNRTKHEIAINVSDNGDGIAEKDLQVIFRRFKQLGTNPRGSCKGFGLGLSIAKELVRMNFGEMSVESTLGKGSTFSFTVPLDEPAEVLRRYFRRLRKSRTDARTVALISATADDPKGELAEEIAAFLSGTLRRNDLLFYRGGGRWLIVALVADAELETFFNRIRQAAVDTNRNRFGPPLPAIDMTVEGSWNIRTDVEEITAFLRDLPETFAASPQMAACFRNNPDGVGFNLPLGNPG
jgi:signal transduction histidine kinase